MIYYDGLNGFKLMFGKQFSQKIVESDRKLEKNNVLLLYS